MKKEEKLYKKAKSQTKKDLDEIKKNKKKEIDEQIKKVKEQEKKITDQEIQAFDEFYLSLSEEDANESLSIIPPDLEDFEEDSEGNPIQYERSPVRKSANVSVPLTSDHLKELAFCSSRPIYTIKNYFKIVSQDKGLMNFKLYEFQAQFIKDAFGHKRLISSWPRQSGKCVDYNTNVVICKKPLKGYKKILYNIINKLFPTFFDEKFID